ncbi:MAG: hypothetical protein QF886_25855, partial [Planctomycetota bacterium]|nr:hypothetical protein [Planctomycetota bacterium]
DSSSIVHLISLLGEDDAELSVQAPKDCQVARRKAEQVAKFLSIPLHDETTDPHTIRNPDELDIPLREKILEEGPVPEPPAQPEKSKVKTRREGDDLVFEIPEPGFHAAYVMTIGIMSAFMVLPMLFLYVFIRAAMENLFLIPVCIVVFLVFIVPMGYLILDIYSLATGKERLRVSPSGVHLKREAVLGSEDLQISVDELEEVSLEGTRQGGQSMMGTPTMQLVCRSDEVDAKCGRGLLKEDLDWIADNIRYEMCREIQGQKN